MVKVGLIGAGVMGGTHVAAYKNLSEVTLKTICDLNEEKARKLMFSKETQNTTDLATVLNDPDIDMVDICLPTYLHKDVTVAAAKAGKHVFCEKPIALTVEDATEMVEVCKEAGVKFSVGHVVRFFPDYFKVKNMLASGSIGEPKVVRTSRGGGFPDWSWENWYGDYAKSGGPIVDLIIYDFDFLRWTFGPVKRVYAKNLGGNYEGMDHALVTLRFENGIIAHVEGSWAHPQGSPFVTSLEIAGTKGIYRGSNQKSMPVITRTATGSSVATSVPESPLANEPYTAEIESFVNSIVNDTPVKVSGEDAIEALRIALAAVESASSGKVVHMGGTNNA